MIDEAEKPRKPPRVCRVLTAGLLPHETVEALKRAHMDQRHEHLNDLLKPVPQQLRD